MDGYLTIWHNSGNLWQHMDLTQIMSCISTCHWYWYV